MATAFQVNAFQNNAFQVLSDVFTPPTTWDVLVTVGPDTSTILVREDVGVILSLPDTEVDIP